MNHYAIWIDLAQGADDLAFVAAVDAYLGRLRERGEIEGWRIMRRKFGFGPDELGEFFLDLEFRDLTQLDAAFHHAATRGPEIESLHREVFSRVSNFRSALYRDFPDTVRV